MIKVFKNITFILSTFDIISIFMNGTFGIHKNGTLAMKHKNNISLKK